MINGVSSIMFSPAVLPLSTRIARCGTCQRWSGKRGLNGGRRGARGSSGFGGLVRERVVKVNVASKQRFGGQWVDLIEMAQELNKQDQTRCRKS